MGATAMTRWLLRATAVSAGWTGFAAAQSLPPAALANTGTAPAPAVRAAAPDEAVVVLLMRTTGQPDRKLKVLKRSAFDDGEVLVDVQDVGTGQTFTLPGKLADKMPRAGAAPLAAPPPPVQPPLAMAVSKPQVAATVPALKPTVPLPPPAAVSPAPVPSAVTEWKTITPDAVPAPKPAVPEAALVPVPSPTAVPPSSTAKMPTPLPAPVGPPDRWKPIPLPLPPTPSPTPKPPGDGAEITVRGQMPSSLGGRPTAFQRPVEAAPQPWTGAPGTLPASDRLLPNALPSLSVPPPPLSPPPLPPKAVVITPPPPEPPKPVRVSPPTFAPKMPAALPPPTMTIVEPPKPPTVTPPSSPPATPGMAHLAVPLPEESVSPPAPQVTAERMSSWTPTTPKITVERSWGDDPLARAVLQEMRPLENDLTTAARPTVRMAAASHLAEMRYAARPEVKAVLVRSAMTDPAMPVRTECVRALAQLGYSDPEYVAYLHATAGDRYAPELLRLAALEALRQLRPRE